MEEICWHVSSVDCPCSPSPLLPLFLLLLLLFPPPPPPSLIPLPSSFSSSSILADDRADIPYESAWLSADPIDQETEEAALKLGAKLLENRG